MTINSLCLLPNRLYAQSQQSVVQLAIRGRTLCLCGVLLTWTQCFISSTEHGLLQTLGMFSEQLTGYPSFSEYAKRSGFGFAFWVCFCRLLCARCAHRQHRCLSQPSALTSFSESSSIHSPSCVRSELSLCSHATNAIFRRREAPD